MTAPYTPPLAHQAGLAPWLRQAQPAAPIPPPGAGVVPPPGAAPWYKPQMDARTAEIAPLVEMARQKRMAEELRKRAEEERIRQMGLMQRLTYSGGGVGGEGATGDSPGSGAPDGSGTDY